MIFIIILLVVFSCMVSVSVLVIVEDDFEVEVCCYILWCWVFFVLFFDFEIRWGVIEVVF